MAIQVYENSTLSQGIFEARYSFYQIKAFIFQMALHYKLERNNIQNCYLK